MLHSLGGALRELASKPADIADDEISRGFNSSIASAMAAAAPPLHLASLQLVDDVWLEGFKLALARELSGDLTAILDVDCMRHIFSQLGFPSLFACRQVSHTWRDVSVKLLRSPEWRAQRLQLRFVGTVDLRQGRPASCAMTIPTRRGGGAIGILCGSDLNDENFGMTLLEGPFTACAARLSQHRAIAWDNQYDVIPHSRCLKVRSATCLELADDGTGRVLVVTIEPLVGDRLAQIRDADSGELLLSFGDRADRRRGAGWRKGQLKQPTSAVWLGDEIFVTDEGRRQVVIFSAADGRELRKFGGGGTGPDPYHQFEQAGPMLSMPCSVSAWHDRLYVADRHHRRVFALARGTGKLLTSWPYEPACEPALAALCRERFAPSFDEAHASVCAGRFGVLVNAGTDAAGCTKAAHHTHAGALLAEYTVFGNAELGVRLDISAGPHVLGRQHGAAIYCLRICEPALQNVRGGMERSPTTGELEPWLLEQPAAAAAAAEGAGSAGGLTVLEFCA